jgi:UDP-glucose 4-epimerase
MKKVLVTGACGYLGARLSKHLAENGYRITAFDSFDPSGYSQWTSIMEEVIVGDIRDETTLSSLAKKEFDAVIHLISLDHHKSEDDPNLVSSINVMPTWNLLDTFVKHGLDKFIYFSTIHVYGKLPNKIISENHTLSPLNAYGLTHLLSENICNYFNKNTDTNCINVRLSNSYGSPVFKENNCWWLVINDLCKSAFTKNKIKLFSDGSPQRDFINIFDICRAIEILIELDNSLDENIFHIASGETLTILELAHIVKEVYTKRYNKNIPIVLQDNLVSEDPSNFKNVERFILDIESINGLGFQKKTNLETELIGLFNYLETNYENE